MQGEFFACEAGVNKGERSGFAGLGGLGLFLKYFLKNCLLLSLMFFCSYSQAATINKPQDIIKLEKGQVLQKSIQGKSLLSSKSIKGSESKILIDASAEKVWDVLYKKENLPKIIRQIQDIKILKDNNNGQEVKTSIKLCKFLPTFDYIFYFDNTEKYRKMKFRKTDGCFKELYGYFELTPYGDSTILGYKIYSDPGFYIPGFITKGLRSNAKDIMKSIKKEAETQDNS